MTEVVLFYVFVGYYVSVCVLYINRLIAECIVYVQESSCFLHGVSIACHAEALC